MLDDYRLERNSQYRQPHYTDYGAPSTLDIQYDPYRPCFSFIASIKQRDWVTGKDTFSLSGSFVEFFLENSDR